MGPIRVGCAKCTGFCMYICLGMRARLTDRSDMRRGPTGTMLATLGFLVSVTYAKDFKLTALDHYVYTPVCVWKIATPAAHSMPAQFAMKPTHEYHLGSCLFVEGYRSDSAPACPETLRLHGVVTSSRLWIVPIFELHLPSITPHCLAGTC